MKEKMAPNSQFWLTVDNPNNLSVLTGLIVLDSPIDLLTFRLLIEERLMDLAPFQEKVVEELPPKKGYRWITDDQFDIRAHVELIRLKNEDSDEDLQRIISETMSKPMDMNKPPWQFLLVKRYQSGCAIIPRIHQSLMHRVDLIRVLWSLSDEYKKKSTEDSLSSDADTWMALPALLFDKARSCIHTSLSVANTVVTTCLKPFTNPFYMIEKIRIGMGSTADRLSEIGRIMLINSDSDSVLKKPLNPKKLYAWSRPFSLNDIQNLSKATNATMNVIYITALTGTIKDYLKFRKNAIDYREIRALIPVDMRMTPGSYSGATRFGVIPFDLPVHINDPFHRIAEVKRRIQKIDFLPDAVSVFNALMNLGFPPHVFAEKLAIPFAQKSSLVMTNTQGPAKALSINQVPVTNIMYWLPRVGDIGLGTTILSYNQEVRLGMICDTNQIPDTKPFIEAFEKQLAYLLEYAPKHRSKQVSQEDRIAAAISDQKLPPIAIDNLTAEMSELG